MMETEVLIIGAGLSGLILGKSLVESNKKVLILEKSRGVGGRISTRRIDNQGLDHGTLYLKHDPVLIDLIFDSGLSTSLRVTDEGYFIAGGMTAFPKALAQKIPLRKETKVTRIIHHSPHWIAETETGENFKTNKLVLTAPLPQALELLHKSQLDLKLPDEIINQKYQKGILGIFTSKGPEPIPYIDNKDIFSLTPMIQRELHPEGYVLRMTPEFSEKHFHFADELLLEMLRHDFIKSFSTEPQILSAELKKWKYLVPEKALNVPFIEPAPSLYLIGDSFLHPDTRGAIMSARELLPKLV